MQQKDPILANTVNKLPHRPYKPHRSKQNSESKVRPTKQVTKPVDPEPKDSKSTAAQPSTTVAIWSIPITDTESAIASGEEYVPTKCKARTLDSSEEKQVHEDDQRTRVPDNDIAVGGKYRGV